MGIGKTLARVFADHPDTDELLGHPIRIWRNAPTHERVAIGLTFVAVALIVAAGIFILGGPY